MAARRKTTTESSTTSTDGEHYKVLARRWRPQQFDELVGQEAIAQALKGAIAVGRVAHAYLFTGSRGVGKTSTARILAKALNCQGGPTATPCDKCDACESIATGDDVDVLEIDGASNRGIDEVRELRQNAHFRPTRSRYKIYIIDEVHMLTREAFNALLKTLEEPPAHVKFIFATTDAQRIPLTILSRCQRFDFGSISTERIHKRLDEIVRTEKIAVDDEVLELVARRAAGSMRDALSLLDQLLAFGGERVTAEQVHRLLGTAREDRLMELVASLIGRNAGPAIAAVDQAEAEGVQLGELTDQLIEYFRDLMVVKSAGKDSRLVSVSSRQRPRVVEQAAGVPLEFVLAGADILAETKARLRGSTHGRVLVDVALVRISSLEDLAPLGELAERLSALEGRLAGPAAGSRPVAAPAGSRTMATPDSKKNFAATETGSPAPAVTDAITAPSRRVPGLVDSALAQPPSAEAPAPATAAPVIPNPLTPESAAALLREIAQEFNPLLRESIARARLSFGPAADLLVVHLDPMYNSAGRAKELELALERRLAGALRVRVEVAAPAGSVSREPTARRPSYTERLSEAARDPLVQHAIDVFGARIIRVDES